MQLQKVQLVGEPGRLITAIESVPDSAWSRSASHLSCNLLADGLDDSQNILFVVRLVGVAASSTRVGSIHNEWREKYCINGRPFLKVCSLVTLLLLNKKDVISTTPVNWESKVHYGPF